MSRKGEDLKGPTVVISESPDVQLSFVQRHFHRPTTNDPEQYFNPEYRRFSALSRGFLLVAGIVSLMFLAIVCTVLGITLVHRHRFAEASKHASPLHEAIVANFPDPSLLFHDNTWYAFATNNAAGILHQPDNQTAADYGSSNVQIATSQNFRDWDLLNSTHDPLPLVGDWAVQGLTDTKPHVYRANLWAPMVIKRPSDGHFVMYYSAAANGTRSHCVGAAVAGPNSPAGPYTAINDTIACPVDVGGAIDPAAYIEKDGTIYLTWKVDGNNHGNGGSCGNTNLPQVDTPIIIQKMKPDGFTPDGEKTTILHRTDDDGPLVEAPAIVKSSEGIYFLFFSSGCTRAPTYDLKYATSKHITGPYTRAKKALLSTGDWGLTAPGSVGIAEDANGNFKMAFHARVPTDQGGVRAMFTSKIQFNGTVVKMIA